MMAAAELYENLYQEEVYRIPPGPMIVLDKAWDELTADELDLITKIVEVALKLTFPKVRITTRPECDPADLLIFNPSNVILFGVRPVSPEYQRYERIDVGSASFVYADSLSDLDDARKKSLWRVMRPMFGV